MEAALEELVPRRAGFRCEYCPLPQPLVSTPFQFDHITAESHGGPTTKENLAFACFPCNNFKGPNLAGLDPEPGKVLRLYHPRRNGWKAHFRWEAELIVGLTGIGRATINTLRLNHPARLALRRSLLSEGDVFA
jgi:hypothetical protein